MDDSYVAIPNFLSDQKRLSPLQTLRLLFSYHYCNLVSQFYFRTREYEAGLLFVDRCRELLEQYSSEIPEGETQRIEHDVTFLELSLYDALNLWQEYLDLFEQIFREKRTKAYIAEYQVDTHLGQMPEERFGRYLMSFPPANSLSPRTLSELSPVMQNSKTRVFVHKLYLCEHRRAIIERKLHRQQEGKSVEHLKRHQKERLSSAEQEERFAEMGRLFEWMKRNDSPK